MARTRQVVGGTTRLRTIFTKIIVVADTLERTANGLAHTTVLRTVGTTQTALASISGGKIPRVTVTATARAATSMAVTSVAHSPTSTNLFTFGALGPGQRLGLAERVAFGTVVVFQTTTHAGLVCCRLCVTLVAGNANPFLVVGTLAAPPGIQSPVSAHATQAQMFTLTFFTKFTAKDAFGIFTDTVAVHPDRIVLTWYNDVVDVLHHIIQRHCKQGDQGSGDQQAKAIH